MRRHARDPARGPSAAELIRGSAVLQGACAEVLQHAGATPDAMAVLPLSHLAQMSVVSAGMGGSGAPCNTSPPLSHQLNLSAVVCTCWNHSQVIPLMPSMVRRCS